MLDNHHAPGASLARHPSAMLSIWAGRLSLCVLVAFAVWPPRAEGQAVYGSIAGTVTDSTGALVPGTRVTVTSLERNTVDTTLSNSSGLYLKERLLPGRYELKAELTGFKLVVVPSLIVSVDSQTRMDLRLEPGDLAETVTVTVAAGQLLKTDRADVATTRGDPIPEEALS